MNAWAKAWAFYFITFIAKFSHFDHIYLIYHKSDALECFTKYSKLVVNQLDTSIKAQRTNRDREYLYE